MTILARIHDWRRARHPCECDPDDEAMRDCEPCEARYRQLVRRNWEPPRTLWRWFWRRRE